MSKIQKYFERRTQQVYNQKMHIMLKSAFKTNDVRSIKYLNSDLGMSEIWEQSKRVAATMVAGKIAV